MLKKHIVSNLNSTLYLLDKNTNLPLHSINNYSEGLNAIIFENNDDVHQYLNLHSLNNNEYSIERIDSIYDKMIEFSRLGYTGISYNNKSQLYFSNSYSEFNCEFPTILCYTEKSTSEIIYIGGSGILNNIHSVKQWKNSYRSDNLIRILCESYFCNLPINDLFIILFDGEEPYSSDDTFLFGHHGVQDAICIFTSLELANHSKCIIEGKESATLRLEQINFNDLITYLNKLYIEWNDYIDICLNPFSNRLFQGYFFKSGSNWYLKNLGGIYKLNSGAFDKCDDPDSINNPKNDCIAEPGQIDRIEMRIKSVAKYPFKRFLKNTLSSLSYREAGDIIQNELKTSFFLTEKIWKKPINLEKVGKDCYLIFGYNKITSEPFSNCSIDTPYIFIDVFEACSFFYHCLFPLETEIKVGNDTEIYFLKKVDPESAEFYLREAKRGLERLMEEMLTNGYKPVFSSYLRKYINETSFLLQIEMCGYVEDIAFYESHYIANYIKVNNECNDPYTKKVIRLINTSNSKPSLDYNLQKEITRYLGSSEINIDFDSKLMLETALNDFRAKGKSLSVDYAPISMELCKVVERELKKKIFQTWKSKYLKIGKEQLQSLRKSYSGDVTIKKLCEWLDGREKALDLGSMKFIILATHDESSIWIFQNFRQFLNELPSGEFILSKEFQEAITRISTKYRNGGVHEHKVSYETCEEAFIEILLGENNLLKRILCFAAN